jgi:penicillin-binding protein 1B
MPKRRQRRTRRKKKVSRKSHSRKRFSLLRWMARLSLIAIPLIAMYMVYLDFQIRGQFEGKRWAVPARVYARPLELYAGQAITIRELKRELDALGYANQAHPTQPGSYAIGQQTAVVVSRGFRFWDGEEASRRVRLYFDTAGIQAVESLDNRAEPGLLRLDPIRIGSIYPQHNEDRVLVQLAEVPEVLVQALIAIEDRDFYTHHGIAPRAIARALWQNLRAGHTVQGGSTLTQQLVKNFFLSPERSLWRKGNEALMALLLEMHYDKPEILEAYLNEIYLGQAGRRAVHGVGLASHFYFNRDVSKLSLPQAATLVALIKGPSYYEPRRHPERALKRRNLVLDVMYEQGMISERELQQAKRAPLGVAPRAQSGDGRYPAFMDLVRRQLRRDYRAEDLSSEGLQIFTTLDPNVQRQTEGAIRARLQQLEQQRRLKKGLLESAAVVTSVEGAEVLAVVGGRKPRFAGFNRALDAVRPVGSLIKPAVYLTALERQQRYNLATRLDDSPLVMEFEGDKEWRPQNYDKKFHGDVLLHDALVKSYNIPTIRLAQNVGINAVRDSLEKLGMRRPVHSYASLALGTVAYSPLEVTQMYQVYAADGFRSPLRAIREVLDARGEPLQRYPLTVEQAFDPRSVYLLNNTLQSVTQYGTAKHLQALLPQGFTVAGKTGTTDDLRDSWFAGFTGNRVAVVWVGADDNAPTGLTGSSGAMLVWRDIINGIPATPFTPIPPDNIETVWIDRQTGQRGNSSCEDAVLLPFIKGTAPEQYAPCGGGLLQRAFDWIGGE